MPRARREVRCFRFAAILTASHHAGNAAAGRRFTANAEGATLWRNAAVFARREEVAMYARVTQFRIPPEKLDEFVANSRAIVSLARQQKGFRALFVLRAGGGPPFEVRVFSIWNSEEDLRAGEQNFYLYQALAKVLAYSKGFPLIEGQEVLVADFPAAPGARSSSADETQF